MEKSGQIPTFRTGGGRRKEGAECLLSNVAAGPMLHDGAGVEDSFSSDCVPRLHHLSICRTLSLSSVDRQEHLNKVSVAWPLPAMGTSTLARLAPLMQRVPTQKHA